jgi:hypothetical protein
MTNKWRDAFGRTFQFRGLFSIRELHTSDPKALTHIAFNLPIYQKLPATRYNLARLLGEGKITVHCNLSHFKPLVGITSQEDTAHRLQASFCLDLASVHTLTIFA